MNLCGFVEDKLFVDRIIHAGKEDTDDDLRREIPEMEPLDERKEKRRVEGDVQKGECRVHRELHVHAIGRKILERPQFLQGEANNKCDACRDECRIDVPHMEDARKKIEEREIHRSTRPAGDEIPDDAPFPKRQTIKKGADGIHFRILPQGASVVIFQTHDIVFIKCAL